MRRLLNLGWFAGHRAMTAMGTGQDGSHPEFQILHQKGQLQQQTQSKPTDSMPDNVITVEAIANAGLVNEGRGPLDGTLQPSHRSDKVASLAKSRTEPLELEMEKMAQELRESKAATQRAEERERQTAGRERQANVQPPCEMNKCLGGVSKDFKIHQNSCRPFTYHSGFEIVGNLIKVKEDIIATLHQRGFLNGVPLHSRLKEELDEALHVVAPPWHGKSLLLDLLADHYLMNHSSKCRVIKVSYNGFNQAFHDLDNKEAGFFLRILHSLCEESFGGSVPLFPDFVAQIKWESSFPLTWDTLRMALEFDSRPVLLLVDDVTQPPTKIRKQIELALRHFVGAKGNAVVLTGCRTQAMKEFFCESGIPVSPIPFVLERCEADDAIAIAKRIRAADAQEFDQARWQVSKLVPGLMGYWLESVLEARNKAIQPPWLLGLHNHPELTEQFLCDYLEHGATGIMTDSRAKRSLRIAERFNLVLADQTICLGPVYDAVIRSKSFVAKTEVGKHIFSAVQAAAEGRDDSGQNFEVFLGSALSARLELVKSRMEKDPGTIFTLQSLFGLADGDIVWTLDPVDASGSAGGTATGIDDAPTNRCTSILVPLTTPQTVARFIGALYNIFPDPLPKPGSNHYYLTSDAMLELFLALTNDSPIKTTNGENSISDDDAVLERWWQRNLLRDPAENTKYVWNSVASRAEFSDPSSEIAALAGRLIQAITLKSDMNFEFHLEERRSLGELCDVVVEASKLITPNEFALTLPSVVHQWRSHPPFPRLRRPSEGVAAKLSATTSCQRATRVTLPTRHCWSPCSARVLPCLTENLSKQALNLLLPNASEKPSAERLLSKSPGFAEWLKQKDHCVASSSNEFVGVYTFDQKVSSETATGPAVLAIQANDRDGFHEREWGEVWQKIEQRCIYPLPLSKSHSCESHTASLPVRIIIIVSRSNVELSLQQQVEKKFNPELEGQVCCSSPEAASE